MRLPADSIGRLARFTAVGLAAMAAYVVAVTALAHAGLRPAWLASGAAYALAAVWSYVGHRRFSFRSGAAHSVAGPRFVAATAAGQTLAVAIPALLTDAGGLPQIVSTAAVCLVCPAASYLLNSRFVFPDRPAAPETP
jgi:putative flippase GtrA